MLVSFSYFAAGSDEVAAGVLRDCVARRSLIGLRRERSTAPGQRFQAISGGLAAVEGYSVDPVVQLATLQALLTHRPYEEVTQSTGWGRIVASAAKDACLVIEVLDGLQAALREAPEARLSAVAGPWGGTEEIEGVIPADELLAFLLEMAALCRSAANRGLGVYCLVEA